MNVYLETSAAAKLLVEEAESAALATYLDDRGADDANVSSALLETELRRFAVRCDLDQSAVSDLVARVDLIDPPRSMFREAGLLTGKPLRSLDALHLATALRLDAHMVVAYNGRLIQAARSLGLATVSPA